MIGTAESFPVPYRERTNIGRDAVNRFEWQYFTSGGKSNRNNAERVGKKLRVSGEHLLTIELNRETDSQVLRLERTQAMLNVTNSIDSLRISMLPSGLFATMILEKNPLGMPTSWRWGDMRAEMKYDSSSRVKEVRTFPNSITKYEYRSALSSEPYKVIIPSGGTFVFNRNNEGALEYIMTPRGHIHAFSTQFSLGFQRFSYLSPWTRHAYEEHIDHQGRLIARVWPEQTAKMVYVYDPSSGLVQNIVGGTSSVGYAYIGGTNLLKSL
jgi:hypothetical protein